MMYYLNILQCAMKINKGRCRSGKRYAGYKGAHISGDSESSPGNVIIFYSYIPASSENVPERHFRHISES